MSGPPPGPELRRILSELSRTLSELGRVLPTQYKSPASGPSGTASAGVKPAAIPGRQASLTAVPGASTAPTAPSPPSGIKPGGAVGMPRAPEGGKVQPSGLTASINLGVGVIAHAQSTVPFLQKAEGVLAGTSLESTAKVFPGNPVVTAAKAASSKEFRKSLAKGAIEVAKDFFNVGEVGRTPTRWLKPLLARVVSEETAGRASKLSSRVIRRALGRDSVAAITAEGGDIAYRYLTGNISGRQAIQELKSTAVAGGAAYLVEKGAKKLVGSVVGTAATGVVFEVLKGSSDILQKPMDKYQRANEFAKLAIRTGFEVSAGTAVAAVFGGNPIAYGVGSTLGKIAGEAFVASKTGQAVSAWAGQNGLKAFEAMVTAPRRAEQRLAQAADRMLQYFEPFKSKMRFGGLLA